MKKLRYRFTIVYFKLFVFRNIKDFMVQTGDPTGTGKGGNSIWGGPFDDELSVELRVSFFLNSVASHSAAIANVSA